MIVKSALKNQFCTILGTFLFCVSWFHLVIFISIFFSFNAVLSLATPSSDESKPRLGSGSARSSPFFGGIGLDLLGRAQARSRLGLDFWKMAQKIGAFI